MTKYTTLTTTKQSAANLTPLSRSYLTAIQTLSLRSSTSHPLTEGPVSTSHETFETRLQFSTSSLTQTDSIKKSILAVHVWSSHSTPTLQSNLSSTLSSLSSLSTTSSSKSPFLPPSSTFLIQILAHASISFSTTSPTTCASTFHYVPSFTSSLDQNPTFVLVPSPTFLLFFNPTFSMNPSPSAGRPKNGVEIEMRPGYNVSNYFSLITFFLRVSSDLKVMVMLILWIKIVACHWQLLEHSFYSAFSLGQNLRSDLDNEPAIQTDKRVTDTLISTRRGLTVVIKLEAQYLSKKWNAREHEKSVNHEPGASKFQTFRVFFLLHC